MAAKLYLCLMLILLGTITVQGARQSKKMNHLHSYLMHKRHHTGVELCEPEHGEPHGSECVDARLPCPSGSHGCPKYLCLLGSGERCCCWTNENH